MLICTNVWAQPKLTPKQQQFIQFLLPKIKQISQNVLEQRKKLKQLYEKFQNHVVLSEQNYFWIAELAKQYDMKNPNFNTRITWSILLKRVDLLPLSLVIAQAANESAWGTSRFAKEGNNYFGQICYPPGCGMVPKQRPPPARFQVKRYPSALASIKSYLKNLNTNKRYQKLRQLRYQQHQENKTLNSLLLAKGLIPYSIIGERYVLAIQNLIRSKQLTYFDHLYPSFSS